MGYTTEFTGKFDLNKKLDPETHMFLTKLSKTRRMSRLLGPEYGVGGEFYVDGGGEYGQDHESNILDFNSPPSTQPSLWCDWTPSEDGLHIEWNGAEKFYSYVEWLRYIIKNFLQPKGFVLNGDVAWQGEDSSDLGHIVVVDNTVMALEGPTYDKVVSIVGKPVIKGLKKTSTLPLLLNICPEVEAFVEACLKEDDHPMKHERRRIQWQ